MRCSFSVLIAVLLFYLTNAYAEKNILYMCGDYSSVEYHLGVLSELEKLQIPIDSIVACKWGSFVGALWSSGKSSKQIRELILSWDSIPYSKKENTSFLWKKEWFIKHNTNGIPVLEEIEEEKPYFGQVFFDLRVQENLKKANIGSKIPFYKIEDNLSFPFPNSKGEGNRILSTTLALRDTNGTPEERYQQKLYDTDSSLIILRPHNFKQDSLFEEGIAAVQKKRSALAKLSKKQNVYYAKPSSNFNSGLTDSVIYVPVFDSISSETQRHLESFWNPNDSGILAVKNFLILLQEEASYRDVKLSLDTNSLLLVNASNSPSLKLALFGVGSNIFGANIGANVNFRFINQFGYNLNLTAFYGQGIKGFEPSIYFERFFLRDGSFFVKANFLEYKPIDYFQKSIHEKARIIKEKNSIISFGIEKKSLQIAVSLDNREITSGTSAFPVYEYADDTIPSGFIYKPVTVKSLFPYAKWLRQSKDYNRWFAGEGFMSELFGGFRAISIQTNYQNTPLYFSSQGKINITHGLFKYVFVSAGMEFGANFRITKKGEVVLPDSLYYGTGNNKKYDEALDNHYKFAMGMGSYSEKWNMPYNSSHRYGIVSTGLSLQNNGNGLFLSAGYAKNADTTNSVINFNKQNLFVEPKIRLKTSVFDFVLGQSIIFSAKNISNITDKREITTFFNVQSINF